MHIPSAYAWGNELGGVWTCLMKSLGVSTYLEAVQLSRYVLGLGFDA